ncbi:FMN-linked oxidoreductase [Guyanagaster necrorhizus]|uniref:FMN-linked oxidoreductase n=1 Tax=Guyanagaster necrorhizus TaxID=856835 RepID=A0A9P7VXI4_9AGAR|nr:FMN-linked oxidoreductase [Guyanagaster necrorhizus MCA 3950]KAG7448555.1 FMN-linked oxidoreductase [Guyanagaster necrorhizus MCA 3950]
MAPSAVNIPASGVSFFTPAQIPPAGTAVPQPDGKPIPTLFQPLTIREVTFQNRIFLSPLCQYSAQDGIVTPWHTGHLGGIFTRGPGLSIIEATAIVPEGRITPNDVGIWSDDHIAPLASIVEYAHSQNQKIAIQIAHAGRKASTIAPWIPGHNLAGEDVGGWPSNVFAPSPIPFADDYPTPKELTKDDLKGLLESYKAAAQRAVKAGFDVIEIHGAHGYLLCEFMSPTSNKRTDEYGGSFENRIRFPLEVVDVVRSVIPESMPLFFRISGSERLEESLPDVPSWRSEDTVRLAPILAQHGIDLLDVSSGGNNPKQKFTHGPAYQAPLAHDVKKSNPGLVVSAVGSITDGHIAQNVLDQGQADLVMVGRHFQRNPGLVWSFADDLGVEVTLANQIHWGFRGRRRKPADN